MTFCALLARYAIVCGLVLSSSVAATATPRLTVARILHDGVSRGATPGLPLKRNQTLAPTSRIAVPNRVVVIIAYGKSTATLAANTVAIFNWTGTLEQVIISGGRATFDDPLDAFRVSAHLITASHHSTVFAFDVDPERVTVTCTEGNVVLTTAGAGSARTGTDAARSQVVRTDLLSDSGTASVTYAAADPDDLDLLARDNEAAARGDVYGESNLGSRYYFGRGVPKDYAKARHYFELSANQGYALAQSWLGYLYEQGQGAPQNYIQARRYYEMAARQGDASAQDNLGYLYHFGRGVPQDYVQARRYYELASAQGAAVAQNNLGSLYDKGQGVPRDSPRARRYLELAAAQGLPSAQAYLGYLYHFGRGVPRNYTRARHYYELAAAQGNATAQNNLGYLYEHGHSARQDFTRARHYYEMAATQGLARADYHLGTLYERGEGVAKNDTTALRYYKLAAVQGDSDAIAAVRRVEGLPRVHR